MRIATLLGCLLVAACGHGTDEPTASRPRESVEQAASLRPVVADPVAEPNPSEATAPAPAPSTETALEARPFVPGPCELGESVDVGASQARRTSVALDFDARGGLVAFSDDDAHVTLQPLDPRARPSGAATTIEMPGAMNLREMHRIGALHLLVSHTLCPDTPPHQALKCLFLQPFDASGHAVGVLFQHQTGEWSGGPSAISGDALVMLRSHVYMPPVLERYHLAPDGTITREQLGDLSHGIARGEAEPAQGEALAVEGERIAALVRVGAEPAAYFLHFADGRVVSVRGRPLPEEPWFRFMGFTGADEMVLSFMREHQLFQATLSTDGALARPTRVAEDTLPSGPIQVHLAQTQEHDVGDLGLMRGDARWVDEPIVVDAAHEMRAAGVNGIYALATVANGPRPRAVRVRPARCVAPDG